MITFCQNGIKLQVIKTISFCVQIVKWIVQTMYTVLFELFSYSFIWKINTTKYHTDKVTYIYQVKFG